MLLNVQSVRNKVEDLDLFIDSMHYPDFILLTEHWLREGEPFFLNDYILLSSYCRSKSVHGGTMILMYNKLLDVFIFFLV